MVNSGLILAADNEAELAGVMAHEIAHDEEVGDEPHALDDVQLVPQALVVFFFLLGRKIRTFATNEPEASSIAFPYHLLEALVPGRAVYADGELGITGFDDRGDPFAVLLGDDVIVVNGFIGISFGMIIFTSAIESIP